MKPLNKKERWYVFLWLLLGVNRKSYNYSRYYGELHKAGTAITDDKRHVELQNYGKELSEVSYE